MKKLSFILLSLLFTIQIVDAIAQINVVHPKEIPSLLSNENIRKSIVTNNYQSAKAKTTADSFAIPIAFDIKQFDTITNAFQNWDSSSLEWRTGKGKNFDITQDPNFEIYNRGAHMIFSVMKLYHTYFVTYNTFSSFPHLQNIHRFQSDVSGVYESKTDFLYNTSNNEQLDKVVYNDVDSVTYIYNAAGQITHQYTYHNNKMSIDTALYDSNGKLTAHYAIASNGNVIINGYTYNNNDDTIVKTQMQLDSNVALKSISVDSFYYSTQLDSNCIFAIDLGTSAFSKYLTNTYYYDAGNLTQISSTFHIPISDDYSSYYIRNSSGLIKDYYMVSNGDTLFQINFLYNSKDLLTEAVESHKNGTSWENNAKIEIIYNAFDLPEKLYRKSKYDPATSQFINSYESYESTIYYEIERDTTNAINKIANANITVFPNPSNTNINVSASENDIMEQISIYDAMGRLIKKHNKINQKSHTINIATLPNGIYVLEVATNNGIGYKKFIKE